MRQTTQFLQLIDRDEAACGFCVLTDDNVLVPWRTRPRVGRAGCGLRLADTSHHTRTVHTCGYVQCGFGRNAIGWSVDGEGAQLGQGQGSRPGREGWPRTSGGWRPLTCSALWKMLCLRSALEVARTYGPRPCVGWTSAARRRVHMLVCMVPSWQIMPLLRVQDEIGVGQFVLALGADVEGAGGPVVPAGALTQMTAWTSASFPRSGAGAARGRAPAGRR